jgi:hypothetical protein
MKKNKEKCKTGYKKGWGFFISFCILIMGKTLQRRRLVGNLVTMVELK